MRPIVERKHAVKPSADLARIVEQLYLSRGIHSSEEASTELAGLLPVGSLENTAAAVELLLTHRQRRIIVIGDFDADGATSAALMLRCLTEFGFSDVGYLVPNRFDFGYGLSPEIVAVAARRQPALLITVDNGISSVDGVKAARDAGIDVLVTDHHLPPAKLPDANVIVNPNLPDSRFGSGNLAGVGVAFYVLAALGRTLSERGQPGAERVPARYLDLVALGTVADVVPLDRNNRILVEQGLRRIRAGLLVPGLRALLAMSGRALEDTVSADLGFVAGPRINAAGRLDDISVGIECLLTDDDALAGRLAAALDGINRERRDIEADMREQAFDYVARMNSRGLPACVCVFDETWHQGVVGLIASRVRERCHRPVVAFAREDNGQLKGSARSVPGVHVRDLLEAVNAAEPGLIVKFGGHAMAAGLSLDAARLERFRSLISSTLLERYPDADFSGAIVSDGVLPDDALSLPFARELRHSGPWGAGFPEPVWHGNFEVVEQRTVGERHLKLKVRPLVWNDAGSNDAGSYKKNPHNVIDAIAFGQAGPVWRGPVQLAYRLDVNEFRGTSSAQLVVEQIVAAHAAET